MAKNKGYSKVTHDTSLKVSTKSPYGSHADMVVNHEEYGVTLKENEVLLKCDTHFYITTKKRLDDGLADPARYSGKKLFLELINKQTIEQ
jgi:hypothetical protein